MADEMQFSPDNLSEDAELGSVTLTLEDDTEITCAILGTFEADGNEYIALLPESDSDDEEGDVLLYRYIAEGEDGEPEIANIETDEEYEIAADAFDEIMDSMEFDDEEDDDLE